MREYAITIPMQNNAKTLKLLRRWSEGNYNLHWWEAVGRDFISFGKVVERVLSRLIKLQKLTEHQQILSTSERRCKSYVNLAIFKKTYISRISSSYLTTETCSYHQLVTGVNPTNFLHTVGHITVSGNFIKYIEWYNKRTHSKCWLCPWQSIR